jgi:hypothetical protein
MSQIPSRPEFTLSDFDTYQWIEILDKTEPKECSNYSQEFFKKSELYRLSGDSLGQEIFRFLSEITSTSIEPNNIPDELITSALSDHELTVLRELVLKFNDPEMKARLADILWICKRDPDRARPIQMASLAVDSYLNSAQNLEDIGNWSNCSKRLERAAHLASLVDGKKSKLMRRKIFDHIDNLIDRYVTIDHEFITGSAMKVLQEDFRKHLKVVQSDFYSYAIKYAKIANKKSVCKDKNQNYHLFYYHKRAYREIESEWYKIAGDKESERNARINLAEVDVWYAEQAIANEEYHAYSVAAGRIANAIREYQNIKGNTERIQELHKQMLDYQQKSMSEMRTITIGKDSDFDDPETQRIAIDLVKGKSIRDALYSLAFESNIIKELDEIESEAKETMQLYKSHLIPTAWIDDEGKIKGISGTGKNDLEDVMIQTAKFYQSWYGQNFISPACHQICSEHNISLNDLSFIEKENSFIPQGHETLYTRGLLAGLQGDLIVASHLLIPQLENSLRYILKQNNCVTSHLNIQDDYPITQVLELPHLKEILDEDTVFTLRTLLVEKGRGFNLRNEICHGLFKHDRFFAPEIFYLWWLTLYLCIVYKTWINRNKPE